LIAIIAAAVIVVGAIGVATFFILSNREPGEESGYTDMDEPSGLEQIPNAARMKQELSQDGRSFIPNTQSVESVEILSEETENEEEPWVHHAVVLVNSQDAEVAYVKYGILTYLRNEEKEWILTGIEADRHNLWTLSPIVGAKESLVESSAREMLLWQSVMIDNDEWMIDDNAIENITISTRNTDLNNRYDTVIVDVVLGSEAKTAKGQIELEFTFDNAWILSNHRGHAPFESEYRPSAVFDLTNEQLLGEIVRNDATVLREINWAGQTITMARDEITGLNIPDYESSNKGANRVYNFSFDLDKEIVMFSVDAQVTYTFDSMSGWILGDFTFTPELTSISGLGGTRWEGTYMGRYFLPGVYGTHEGNFIFEIVEVTADGAYRAIASSDNPNIFKMTLTGFINLNDLTMRINFEEWIIETDAKGYHVINDASAKISLQNKEITSTRIPRNSSSEGIDNFTVTLTDKAVGEVLDSESEDEDD